FTVRAAISLALLVDRPSFFSLALMCSYWRSSLLLQVDGMTQPPFFVVTRRDGGQTRKKQGSGQSARATIATEDRESARRTREGIGHAGAFLSCRCPATKLGECHEKEIGDCRARAAVCPADPGSGQIVGVRGRRQESRRRSGHAIPAGREDECGRHNGAHPRRRLRAGDGTRPD